MIPDHRMRVACFVVTALAVACSADGKAPMTVEQVVAESARHEGAMLTLLETHARDLGAARRAVTAYVDEHEAELVALARQRALLEREPNAFATAVQAHRQALADNFERRRRLLETAPRLMDDAAIRAALGRLADL